ncbi:MAG TPA: ABC transporter ATP-binding protein, partial [Candidatus Limnocylindrales bacterium]|nr:ABC transporter ATP-binding protein [Candidatus Limnocylindrales bacterium]
MIGLLRTYLRPYRGRLLLVMGLLLVQAIGNLYLPDLNADIINNGVVLGDNDYIIRTGALMLLVTGLLAITAVIGVYWGARVAMGFGRDVRSAIFTKVETFSQVEVNHFGPASLITRNTNDVQQVQLVVFMGLTIMISAPILIVGGVIMALRTDVPLSGLLLIVLPLMAAVIALVMSRAVPLFRAVQLKIDRINQVMRETLAGVRVIRAFVRTSHEEQRFDTASRDLFDTSLQVTRLFAITIPTMTAIFNLSTVAVIWFGAMRVNDGGLSIGNLTAFMQYLAQILFAVLTAVFMFILIPRAAVSSGRIREVLDTEPLIREPERPITPSDPARRGEVIFDAVEFRYPGAEEPVLREIAFRARPGETTAIVGSTGSGKSTLINLIPRFYDASMGSVHVDGVDVREMGLEDLWQRIGIIPQKAFLFAGTVASNLRFGDENATDHELWHALEIAQAKDFVEEMDGGLEASITQGGTNLSGGQRQRLAIARALVKKAGIYIFDDSFSALDFATDARLRAALDREISWAT